MTETSHVRPAATVGPGMYGPEERIGLLAEGQFNPRNGKTAHGILRHAPNPVVAVIDRENAGKSVRELTGIAHREAPVVATVEEAIERGMQVMVIGIAPKGGLLPEGWRQMIITCLSNGVDVAAGLHTYLGDDPSFAELAEHHRRRIYDVCRPPGSIGVATGACKELTGKRIVLTVGNDCSVGMRHVAIAIQQELSRRGVSARWAPTGQTGIFIAGWGIAIDNVLSDFTAGAAEMLVLEAARDSDVILVEGQGSLLDPDQSGVTLSLIHGSMPTDFIFCHSATPAEIENECAVQPPPVSEMIALHERMMEHIRPARVRGIAVDTGALGDAEARAMCESLARETGLPATDVIRFGAGPLAEALMP